jgi:hypothetical protein
VKLLRKQAIEDGVIPANENKPPGAMLLDRLGPPGFRFTDFRAPR